MLLTSATILADSINNNNRITTFRLHFPRIILPQFLTHRVFSRNGSSSRAIPTSKLLDSNFFVPTIWQKNQPGMQGGEQLSADVTCEAIKTWEEYVKFAIQTSQKLKDLGVHKQIANRPLDSVIYTTQICTATDWDNFFKLRLAKGEPQPEMEYLATLMKNAMDASKPIQTLNHTPFGHELNFDPDPDNLEYEDNIYIHAAKAARVSYNNLNLHSRNEDIILGKKLFENRHMSPFEHLCFSFATNYQSKRFANLTGWVSSRIILTEYPSDYNIEVNND